MATIKFRLNQSKKNTDANKPVSIMVIYYSNVTGQLEYATGEKVIPAKWTGSRVKGTYPNYDKINKHLSNIEEGLLELWRTNKHSSPEELKALIKETIRGGGIKPEKKNVLDVLNFFIEVYSKEKTEGTVKRYKSLRRKILEFKEITDEDKAWPITLDALDFNFYDRFKTFLYETPNPLYKGYSLHKVKDQDDTWEVKKDDKGKTIGLFDEIVYKYFVNIKTVLTWGEKRGFIINPSHKKWEIIKRKYPPISLDLEELVRLENVKLPNPPHDRGRDYLVLECRIGQRISDLKRIKKEEIDHVARTWTHTPKKGSRTSTKSITVHFKGYCENAYFILAKYNFQMPKVSEQKINENLKEACKLAGIDKETVIVRWAGNKKIIIRGPKYEFITSHTGRKTFITIALQFMPPKLVMDLAGIDSYVTLKHYEGNSEGEIIEQYLKSIEDNKPLMKIVNK